MRRAIRLLNLLVAAWLPHGHAIYWERYGGQAEAIAVLYGDAPEGGPLPPIGPLVAFAEQAGRVLDEGFLARRTPAPADC